MESKDVNEERKVVDTNVLTVATGATLGWTRSRIPVDDIEIVQKVFHWVKSFRNSKHMKLVLDSGGTILEEYSSGRNMPEFRMYGRQVVQHKVDYCDIHYVELNYWNNGFERVAELPVQVKDLLHDLGDHKMLAAAHKAKAALVNATDSDWSSPSESEALQLLDVVVEQILTAEERALCREGT